MDFKKVVVAGSGVLGSQIAIQTAYKGFDVTVWLRSEDSIGRAKPKLERFKNIYLKTLEEMKTNPKAYCRGLTNKQDLTDDEIDQLKENLIKGYENMTLTTSYEEAGKDADLIIEAIAEDPKQKIAFYEELAKYLPEKTVIVTNSSTLLPSQFAEYTGRAEKYLALHFANTIWKNNTGEIMGHAGTDQKYYDMVVEFAEAIGMIPLKLKKEQPAYILNSLLVPLLSAAEALWANEVADVETIDLTWKIATGAPLGPFQILDVVGLVTAYNIGIMDPRATEKDSIQGKITAALKKKIDAGETGINAGKGFYNYE
ncbi:MAG: 3-hydroxyacyl-CoA dehydrogenase [Methanobacteriaceae archaeon]|nr:3-hydroxyacyl-CoA dehydrogenase [Methanobacteriaceae archaeon]